MTQLLNVVRFKNTMQKLIFHLNKQLKFKPQLSDYEILLNLLFFKRRFFICHILDDMNSLFLFKQPSFFNACTTAVDSFKHSLQTGLLPFALDCTVFITCLLTLKSMFLRFRSQKHFESSV